MSSQVTIVLLQNVPGLGNKGTLHQVSVPYFQNVLRNKGLAKLADQTTINNAKQKQDHDTKQAQARIHALTEVFEHIQTEGGLTIHRQATQMQHLYDKIDTRDIAQELLMQYKLKVDKHNLHIDHIIDMIGEYPVVFDGEWSKIKFVVNVVQK